MKCFRNKIGTYTVKQVPTKFLETLVPSCKPFLNKRTSTIHLPNKVRLRKAGTYWVVYGLTREMLEATNYTPILQYLVGGDIEGTLKSHFEIVKTKHGVMIKNLEPELFYHILMGATGENDWHENAIIEMREFLETHFGDENDDSTDQRDKHSDC